MCISWILDDAVSRAPAARGAAVAALRVFAEMEVLWCNLFVNFLS